MQFTRLRLSGFKSFVDPTELHIEPGLTGIVGPNGCGKSNLVEALRWVMGETSPKSMRGEGMDDVIFAGTEQRPARNLAEVSLLIDNSARQAPAAFNDDEIIEVTRRIERASGSAYRINGRDVRAKDVQLLFADAATGAHSPALVSQGRIAALIAAKPENRRAILEEAAGISGLHSRRKEAEQRLRAAERNLERLDDVLAQLEAQMANLKRQARQARRYRALSGHLRRTEGSILYTRWKAAAEETLRLEGALRQAEQQVAARTGRAAALSREQASLAAELPARRQAEAEAAAKVQRLTLARETLEAEERRRVETLDKLARQLKDIAADAAREADIRDDAAAALARLKAERERLEAEIAREREAEAGAKEKLETAANAANEAEAAFDALNQRLIEARGRRASLTSDEAAIVRRADRLGLDRAEAARALEDLSSSGEEAGALEAAEAQIVAAEARIAELQEAIATAESDIAAARDARDAARETLAGEKTSAAAIEAEISALEQRLKRTDDAAAEAIAEKIRVEPGFEKALAAAVGDDLDAPEDEAAALHWTALPPYETPPPLPGEAAPLTEHVSAPPALARRLALVGLVSDDATAARLQEALLPGQRLVTAKGGLWRWDGFVAGVDAPRAAARVLEQRNRLAALKTERDDLAKAVAAAERHHAEAVRIAQAAEARALQLREARTAAEAELAAGQRARNEAREAASRQASRRTALVERIAQLDRDLEEAKEQRQKIAAAIAALPDLAALESELEALRAKVEKRRHALAEARVAYDGHRREAEARRHRLEALATEEDAWRLRHKRAEDQLAALGTRCDTAEREMAALAASPADVEAKRQAIADEIEAAEAARRAAADALAELEQAVGEKERALHEVQEALGNAREDRARADAGLESARRHMEELEALCSERFRCAPPAVLDHVDAGAPEELPPLDELERRLERYRAERERLGAVNLRAEEELAELAAQNAHLGSEKHDLEAAIQRLRHAISSLNREGRERLMVAFDAVNAHFGVLFKTLFGGGEARLELVDSDDPLDAGIEILASPPGKRLQSLSLLSGGEQALTALSLIFAVFMTNPAPICVLDEVDAPLDEANVERFCDLLDEMVKSAKTRFLVVTHNEVTMARMHRLFGVTMAERGVSQLVSVDLERAESLVAAQ